jgi:MraZ protein
VVKSGDNNNKGLLMGYYQGRVGVKGRTALPKKFRQLLGEKIILTKGYENCLIAVSQERWQEVVGEPEPFILAPARETERFLLSNAFELELDEQGRFVIPAPLKDFARIENQVVFAGTGNRVEIWAEGEFKKYQDYLSENAVAIAQKLAMRRESRNT